ncbi:MAG: N-acetylmuramoyl-L-alanine amidase [Betaproteobacteria bacterium RBG_16_58_11]|nr:MAG: N-acetylmuramoyl-L-alanine amidase [Betaproteobacteria bacterium RBG_16_58_11]
MFGVFGKRNDRVTALGRMVAALAFFSISISTSFAAEPIKITAARVWPAADYTRITLESKQPIGFKHFTIENPERVVLDLENIELSNTLSQLSAKIGADDPYIKVVRVGRFKPGVVRLVFDLKTEVKPAAFIVKPIGDYGHRLVLDIYPAKPVDPLLALLETSNAMDAAAGMSAPTKADKAAPAPSIKPEEKLAKVEEEKAVNPRKAKGKDPLDLVRIVTIALDAGHGGEDPGAKGARGTFEKDVTLSIAKRVKAKLDEEPNMRGFLVRDGDYFIPLGHRVVKARKVSADLFVSIHADAFINPEARGSSVFALSENGATSAAARWLAKRENEADLIGGVNLDVKDKYLKQTLLDLSQTATINDSMRLGKAVLGELGGLNKLHKAAVEQAGFAVLKAPDIPSILVETAFITNPEEEARLTDDDYQDKMAAAIVSGIKRYFAKSPPLAKPKLAKN